MKVHVTSGTTIIALIALILSTLLCGVACAARSQLRRTAERGYYDCCGGQDYHGGKWEAVPSPDNLGLNAIHMISAEDGWAVGGGGDIARYKDGFWALDASPTQHALIDLHFVSPTEGWAVGIANTILHFQNGKWSVYEP